MNQPQTTLQAAFAPIGKLRASINLGNPLLANRSPSGEPVGVSIDLASELARRLGVGIELVVVDKAQQSVEAVENDRVDIGFFAIDPKRGEHIAFTPPYVDIEGSYLVRGSSPLTSNDEVDRPGHRVVVVAGSAYDLYLSRTLEHAQIVRTATSNQMVESFLAQDHEVLASLRRILEAAATRIPEVRLLPGRFMVIHQAMGLAKNRGAEAFAYMSAFVEEMKQSGFVADSLARHGIQGATVAAAGRVASD